MRFTRSNGTAPWRVDCEDFGTSAAAAIVDTKTGKKVAFAVDQIALGFPDSYLNLSHGDLMIDALNVHEVTGLTPSQLQARVAELIGAAHALLAVAKVHSDITASDIGRGALRRFEGVLNRG